jgi:hypothetical protein
MAQASALGSEAPAYQGALVGTYASIDIPVSALALVVVVQGALAHVLQRRGVKGGLAKVLQTGAAVPEGPWF